MRLVNPKPTNKYKRCLAQVVKFICDRYWPFSCGLLAGVLLCVIRTETIVENTLDAIVKERLREQNIQVPVQLVVPRNNGITI